MSYSNVYVSLQNERHIHCIFIDFFVYQYNYYKEEKEELQWIDVSGDHSDTPQSTNNEEDDELVITLTVGNTQVYYNQS